MDLLPEFLRYFDVDLQPSNSKEISLDSIRENLYPGAHIATSNPYEHYHHGIVVDVEPEDLSIIHFWGREKENGRIQTTTLPIFLAGGIHNLGQRTRRLYLVSYDDDNEEKRQQTVAKAKELLEKADEIVYDIGKRNCESFATFCRTNVWKSEQIERIRYLFLLNLKKIHSELKNADEKNRKTVQDLMKTMSTNSLSSTEQVLFDELNKNE